MILSRSLYVRRFLKVRFLCFSCRLWKDLTFSCVRAKRKEIRPKGLSAVLVANPLFLLQSSPPTIPLARANEGKKFFNKEEPFLFTL
jgi:hypothetical protein